MRSVALVLFFLALGGCDAIVGIGDHALAGTTTSTPDSGLSPDATSPGGAVASLLCGGDSGACVVGAIESVGRVPLPDGGGSGLLPDGAVVTLTDDGFELGGSQCDPTGMDCVTGALSP